MRRGRRYRFDWRDGNEFQMLVDSPRFYTAMLHSIDQARYLICLDMYLFESGKVTDRFSAHFIAAAQRGVKLFFMLDDFGCRLLKPPDRHRLTSAGIHVAYYNPVRLGEFRRSLFRDHRKILIVDGDVAYVGGAGITDEFDAACNPNLYWRDTMVRIRGACVADWLELFASVWREHSREKDLPLPVPQPEALVKNGVAGRVTATRGGEQEVKRSLLKRIRSAERRIWIATAYFVPSRKIRSELRRAAAQGIDVRLLLPGRYTDHPAVRHAGRRFYLRLLRAGVGIYEFQPRFMHQKIILCDHWVSIGSSNIDRWNLRWNLEANQEIDNAAFSTEAAAMLERDFANSVRIDLDQWRKRSFFRRWLEWFWGLVDIWLDRITGHRS